MSNICPRPDAYMWVRLLHSTRNLMAEVQARNPHMSAREAAMWACDGLAEGWELARPAESNLRAYFAAMTPTAIVQGRTVTADDYDRSHLDRMVRDLSHDPAHLDRVPEGC